MTGVATLVSYLRNSQAHLTEAFLQGVIVGVRNWPDYQPALESKEHKSTSSLVLLHQSALGRIVHPTQTHSIAKYPSLNKYKDPDFWLSYTWCSPLHLCYQQKELCNIWHEFYIGVTDSMKCRIVENYDLQTYWKQLKRFLGSSTLLQDSYFLLNTNGLQ